MRTKVVTTSIAFGLACTIAGPVKASTITFETLPDGFTTPTDDAALTSSYTVDGTTVTFGFDTNGDLEIDTDAIFENRNDDYGPGLVGLAYTYLGVPDVDATPTGEGGDWLLRAPQGFNVFIVKYTGASAKSASGQLWDIDWGEKYLIEALDPSGTLISSINTPTVPNREGLDTFNGLPYDFSFNNLASDIGFIRISAITRPSGHGFAFDNFDATGETISQDVPEPSSILSLLGFAGLGSISILKRKLKSN